MLKVANCNYFISIEVVKENELRRVIIVSGWLKAKSCWKQQEEVSWFFEGAFGRSAVRSSQLYSVLPYITSLQYIPRPLLDVNV